MEQLDLNTLRNELDGIDAQLVALFEQRMALCAKVAEYKMGVGKAVYDGAREQQKLETVRGMAHGAFNQQAAGELFSQLMTVSRKRQYQIMGERGISTDMGFHTVDALKTEGVRVVYQGVEGSYGNAAALKFFGEEADLYHVPTMEDAMVEVEEGRADYAVLPIENSSAGAVSDNYDRLVKHNNYIVGEVDLAVRHCLLGLPGAKLSDVKTVYSHPQALMQCSRYLNGHREWQQVSLENTAASALKVTRDQDKSQVAVASETAGKIYGLEVLAEGINHNRNNVTRFLVLSREAVYRKDANKVSICFEGVHKSGSLYNMLGNFIFNNINMLMIESRPIEGRSWEYRFFVDVEGSLSDPAMQNALTGIAQEAVSMRILGCY